MKTLKTIVASILMSAVCSFANQNVVSAKEIVPGPFAVVHFAEAQADLSAEAQAVIADLMRQAMTSGQAIEEVRIASWSDNGLPRQGTKNLTHSDCELADRRIRNIKTFMERYPEASYIEGYNMAERSSRLAKIFKTNEAELKSELEKDQNQSIARQEYRIFRDNGGVSRAVILIMLNSRPQ